MTRGTAWHGNAATLSTVSEAPVGGVRGSGVRGSGSGRRVATRGTAWHGNAATLSTVSEAPVGGVRGSGGQAAGGVWRPEGQRGTGTQRRSQQ